MAGSGSFAVKRNTQSELRRTIPQDDLPKLDSHTDSKESIKLRGASSGLKHGAGCGAGSVTALAVRSRLLCGDSRHPGHFDSLPLGLCQTGWQAAASCCSQPAQPAKQRLPGRRRNLSCLLGVLANLVLEKERERVVSHICLSRLCRSCLSQVLPAGACRLACVSSSSL